jgi:TRAP-type C4-dicarboxylate transport system substrate-binding protein
MSLKRPAIFALSTAAIAMTAALVAAPVARAQDKTVELKISSWVPPAHSLTASFEAWGKSIEEASKGTIKYKIYPSQQLGKAQDHYDMARDGIAEVTFISPGYQPGRFPVIDAAALPFLASNAKDGSAAIDEWYRNYAAKEMKDVKFCLAFAHDPGVWHSKKKIITPDDVKGLKVRPAHATVANLVTLLGGTNAHSSAPEARQLLERGVADAITFPWGSILLFKIDQVVKYHMDLPLYVTPFSLLINQATYDGMSDAQKKVMDDHCTSEWAKKIASPWADNEAAGREKLIKMSDHEVYKLNDAQVAQWQKAVEPLTAQWADPVKKAGWNPDEVLKGLKDTLAKHKSTAK